MTALAIRDACANLAAHLPDQELVRDLLAPPAATGAAAPPRNDGSEHGAGGTVRGADLIDSPPRRHNRLHHLQSP